ncbi:MAG: hypothetical protein ACT4QD_20010 [Acidobacteriota bacterium]
MARLAVLAAFALSCPLAVSSVAWAQQPASELARARALYNQRQFDEAIVAAAAARRVPATADEAAIVLGRAHLERYRERADPSDLSAAREALGVVRVADLRPRDEVELLLAFGQSMFLEDDFGAAAEMLESGLDRAAAVDGLLAEAMYEWWGSAVERHAGTIDRDRRVAAFARLAERSAQRLAANPASAAASYWHVVALRGTGDLDRALDAAVAAWIRARLIGPLAPSLRADLDRLVLQGIIPDRVRPLVTEQRGELEARLRANWELVKAKWN